MKASRNTKSARRNGFWNRQEQGPITAAVLGAWGRFAQLTDPDGNHNSAQHIAEDHIELAKVLDSMILLPAKRKRVVDLMSRTANKVSGLAFNFNRLARAEQERIDAYDARYADMVRDGDEAPRQNRPRKATTGRRSTARKNAPRRKATTRRAR